MKNKLKINKSKLIIIGIILLLLTLPLILSTLYFIQNVRSSAATPNYLETEAGVFSSSGVFKQTDDEASGKNYVLFNKTSNPEPTRSPNSNEIYGPGIAADALNNTRIGTGNGFKSDYRFRADHTANLNSFRVYVVWSHSRPGYHEGNGGTLKFELRTDDGTSSHRPSSTTLATAIHDDPLNKPVFPQIKFSPAPTLQEGQLYHLVVTNIHSDPVNNYVSLNNTFTYNSTTPMQPKFNDLDWAEMQAWNGTNWEVRRSNTPILALYYSDGHVQGHGYMEVWIEPYKNASGNEKFRERFTVSNGNKTISELNIRLRREFGSDPLTYKLMTQGGTIVAQGTIPASSVTTANNPAWIRTIFSTKQLISGQSYFLEFSAPASSVYEAYPIRSGGSYDFPAVTYFSDGYAEYTLDSTTWYGWNQWGVNNRKEQDLQFYFR